MIKNYKNIEDCLNYKDIVTKIDRYSRLHNVLFFKMNLEKRKSLFYLIFSNNHISYIGKLTDTLAEPKVVNFIKSIDDFILLIEDLSGKRKDIWYFRMRQLGEVYFEA